MRKQLILLMIQAIYCLLPIWTMARGEWSVEVSGGHAYCFQTPLALQQSGYEDIKLTAQYATHSFQSPFYYSIRLARWQGARAWEVELVHLKLELTNKPADVQRFGISHGYNLLTVNRVWSCRQVLMRLGAGIVIAHPESTVREKSLNEHQGILNTGYYLAGPTFQATVGKRFSVTQHLFFTVEGKVSGSYATVPLVDGEATVPAVAIHGVFGIGYAF